jgi:Na+/H+-dicarboxylate symporter
MSQPNTASKQEKRASPMIIVYAMVIGILIGYLINTQSSSQEAANEIAGYFSLISDAFLRLIKMIIAPLVFSTLVVGIAHMGDASSVGRVFAKSLGWFFTASLMSLLLGMLLSNLMQPGQYMHLTLPDTGASAHLATSSFSLRDFLNHLIPDSVISSMAKNEILQIVVFSMFFGIAMSAIGEKNKTLLDSIDGLSHIMLKITGYVMKFAPAAVLAAMVANVAENGIGIIGKFAIFMGEFYIGLILLWCVLIFVGYLFLGKRIKALLINVREPFLISFATASSEAAYPKILVALDRFGVSRKISSFVMPMGYSFNLDGSMMYCTFATLFIAQAYGIHLDLGTQITMLLILMLTSNGMAGVPRASLVFIAATLNQFNIPEAGL